VRRHKKRPEKEKVVTKKVWRDRECMERPIKVKNVNGKNHCEFVQTKALRENVVQTRDSQVFTSNLEKPFPDLATWHQKILEIPTESHEKHKVLRGLNKR